MEHLIKSGQVHPDMSFSEKVWAITAQIPKGRVTTYAAIAGALGGRSSRGFRAVGQALGRNPYSPQVPCHRVIGSNGRLTGFAGGLAKKEKMLRSEGVTVKSGCVHEPSMWIPGALLQSKIKNH